MGAKKAGTSPAATLRALMEAIASGDAQGAERLLDAAPSLALAAEPAGATRRASQEFLLERVGHYVYAGDTALHLAAAAHCPALVDLVLRHGADIRARNRRGAEPLHYAADGAPGHERWDCAGQSRTIAKLLAAGAPPDARDRSGVTPLHRAVRTRSAAAVRALLEGGADVHRRNGSGSTPLHLAVQDTGKGGSGTPEARAQQREIIRLLRARGARVTDRDGTGRSVQERARAPWLVGLLD